MHTILIDEKDIDGVTAPKGMRWACSSTAGLPGGRVRVTFLPESCFTNGSRGSMSGPPRCREKSMHVDDWLRQMREGTGGGEA
jgi:hypothetical protein